MDNVRSTPKRRTIQMGIVHGQVCCDLAKSLCTPLCLTHLWFVFQTSAVDQHKGIVMFILASVSANLGFMESIAHNVVLVMAL